MPAAAAARNKKVAIVGCGIAGAAAARTLSEYDDPPMTIHVFDQGRGGVGGRASSRERTRTMTPMGTSTVVVDDGIGIGIGGGDHDENDDDANDPGDETTTTTMMWDHGCQFFRADTPKFRHMVEGWIATGHVREWNGNFASFPPTMSSDLEFFGLPSNPPFYVGADGMRSVVRGMLDDIARRRRMRRPPSGSSSSSTTTSSSTLRVYEGTRVARLERAGERWRLHGTSGIAAYHDTPEDVARRASGDSSVGVPSSFLGLHSGYDAVILTDASSSFDVWHRASAGVPDEFALAVRERLVSRVPLFAAMIAFDVPRSNIPFDAASFDDPVVWFASRSNSKPGMRDGLTNECWTIVSTPEYATAKIDETPMQDPTTGEFIPQSSEYLTSVPGPDLYRAFEALLCRPKEDGMPDVTNDNPPLDSLPNVVHLDAQRWGSALPCHRHLTNDSPTRRVISGVPYDPARHPLAPTGIERDGESFLVDERLMIFQAGDMMSAHTPGLEGAALSGCDAAERLHGIFCASE